jgi:hypothetical protein
LLASVDIVSKEEIVGFWGEATILEQTEKIIVLAMDIATDLRVHDKISIRSSQGSEITE